MDEVDHRRESDLAEYLNLAGFAWERRRDKFLATPWWLPIRKLRTWVALVKAEAGFENAMNLYGEFVDRKRSNTN